MISYKKKVNNKPQGWKNMLNSLFDTKIPYNYIILPYELNSYI